MASPIDKLKKSIAALPASANDNLRMEDLQESVMAALPDLLKDKDAWQSLYIDYESPFLMRLFLPVCSEDQSRRAFISLHYFFGTPDTDISGLKNPYEGRPELAQQESANNYHPHPWAATFRILDGSYKQQVGRAAELGYAPENRPVPYATWEQNASDKNTYTFNDPLLWHRVLPNDGKPVTSLMVTYVPDDWKQVGPRPAKKQRELTQEERDFMFRHFEKMLAPKPVPQKQPKTPGL